MVCLGSGASFKSWFFRYCGYREQICDSAVGTETAPTTIFKRLYLENASTYQVNVGTVGKLISLWVPPTLCPFAIRLRVPSRFIY